MGNVLALFRLIYNEGDGKVREQWTLRYDWKIKSESRISCVSYFIIAARKDLKKINDNSAQ